MKLLGISGKKQSGKNTTANFINGVILKQNGCIIDFNIIDTGELNVLTTFADGSQDWGILDIYRKDASFVESARETIWPYVKNYSFADSLKFAAVELFGLKPENVFGTDEQKMAITHLLWENMPGVSTKAGHKKKCPEGLVYHEAGPMTAREFLQFLGTEIGRKMYPPIWINSTINNIVAEQSGLAIITDVRFPDEVQAIQDAGGYVIRLNRDILEDSHVSETALDPENFDWAKFDLIVDNQNLSIEDSCVLSEQFCRKVELC
jgi:hypothetical protein